MRDAIEQQAEEVEEMNSGLEVGDSRTTVQVAVRNVVKTYLFLPNVYHSTFEM